MWHCEGAFEIVREHIWGGSRRNSEDVVSLSVSPLSPGWVRSGGSPFAQCCAGTCGTEVGLVDGLYAVYRSLQSHKMSGLTVIGDKPAAAATQGVPPTQLYYCDHIFCKKKQNAKSWTNNAKQSHIPRGCRHLWCNTTIFVFSYLLQKERNAKNFNLIHNNHIYTGGAATSDVTQLYYVITFFAQKLWCKKLRKYNNRDTNHSQQLTHKCTNAPGWYLTVQQIQQTKIILSVFQMGFLCSS